MADSLHDNDRHTNCFACTKNSLLSTWRGRPDRLEAGSVKKTFFWASECCARKMNQIEDENKKNLPKTVSEQATRKRRRADTNIIFWFHLMAAPNHRFGKQSPPTTKEYSRWPKGGVRHPFFPRALLQISLGHLNTVRECHCILSQKQNVAADLLECLNNMHGLRNFNSAQNAHVICGA